MRKMPPGQIGTLCRAGLAALIILHHRHSAKRANEYVYGVAQNWKVRCFERK